MEENRVLEAYGWPKDQTAPKNVARVIAVHRGQYVVISALGECRALLKMSAYAEQASREAYPTVGDWVCVVMDAYGTCQIVETLPRKSTFVRSDGWTVRGFQAVAANFDYVIITTSLNQDLKLSRLERYQAAAHQSGAMPVFVLNKADLVSDPEPLCAAVRALAKDAPVLAVSAQTGQGMEQLFALMKPGMTMVFLGSSGVGKSSLINALAGEELMAVNDIREDDAKGRHTTTHRQLIRLGSGLLVIDTPGMRELGLWDATEGVEETFADVEALMGQCRFADCSHGKEPGCAVRAAIASGALQEKRWKRYGQLRREAQRAERMARILEKNDNKRQEGGYIRRNQKRDWEE